ncbi:MAG TPA: SMP-30/gluconolactonase/LRE family protein [Puia sp.]|nr:SMP-30/gluconolactonase/LRE family protein [Puia sp.]
MKISCIAIALLCIPVFYGCHQIQHKDRVSDSSERLGKIEVYSKEAASLIDTSAIIEIIGRHYQWSEGPLWVPFKKMLLFSDVRANKIMSWRMKDTPVAYLSPSGYTDTAFRNGENGSNGLALDKDGKLLLCQSGNRQVVRLNAPLDSPKPDFTVLSSNYNGKKFNSPNDLVADSKNNIYFTDPIYGLPEYEKDPTRELNFEGVYKISVNGKTSLLIDSISRPNGIALSPDEKILYVGSTDEKRSGWYAYHLDADGNIINGRLLLDARALKEKAVVKQGGDGFKIDRYGNLFASGPDGINIISPEGKLLGLIRIYNRPTSNCAFNETKDVLFITANDVVLKVKIH